MLLAGSAAQAQEAPSADVRPAQLLQELQALRRELLQELWERQAERVEQIEARLEQARARRQRLEEAVRAQQEDMGNWSQELQNAEYNPQERAQLEAARTAVDTESLQRTTREKRAAEEAEAALLARLNRARERQRRIAQALGAEPPGT